MVTAPPTPPPEERLLLVTVGPEPPDADPPELGRVVTGAGVGVLGAGVPGADRGAGGACGDRPDTGCEEAVAVADTGG